MKNRKPRVPRIGLDFGGHTTVTGMRQNENGSMTFFGPEGKPLPVQAGFASVAYARDKRPKITVQIPDFGASIGSLTVALARFARVIGVDTNSREHEGEKLCVTAICELTSLRFEGPRWSCRVEPLWALEFGQPTKDPERIGWRHALARGGELGWFRDSANLLLVVDSHLGDLHQINQRLVPLVDDFILPHGVSIAYARSDATSDSALNGLMRRCDHVASEVLDHVTATPPTAIGRLLEAERTPFRAHRYWKFARS